MGWEKGEEEEKILELTFWKTHLANCQNKGFGEEMKSLLQDLGVR